MEACEDNPLYNPLVLKLIYQHLDFRNKKSFRLVCKSWIDTILGHWRKNTKLVICNRLNFILRLDHSNTAGATTFKHCHPMSDFDYFDLYKIQEKPLLNLKLQSVGFSYLPVHLTQLKEKKIEEDFLTFQSLILERFGPSLEYLETFCCPFFQEGKQGAGFRKLLLYDFPKLKVLTIFPEVKVNPGVYKVCKDVFPKTHSDLQSLSLTGGGYSQGTAAKILNLMPNLKKLKLCGGSCDFLDVLKSPLYPSSGGKHLPLETLEVDPEKDPWLSEKIAPWLQKYVQACRPPLKTLKAGLTFGAPGPLQPFLLKPIWSCLENTLTRLKLRVYNRWTWSTLLTGSSLPNLTHLYLRFFNTYAYPRAETGFKFDFGMLKGTPQLKVLYLNHELTSERGAIIEEGDVVWNHNQEEMITGIFLEHLDYFRFELHQKLSESSWRVLAGLMPNLLKIEAIMDETTLPLVLQLWPGLKHCVLSENTIKQDLIAEMRAQNEKVKIEVCEYSPLEWDEW